MDPVMLRNQALQVWADAHALTRPDGMIAGPTLAELHERVARARLFLILCRTPNARSV